MGLRSFLDRLLPSVLASVLAVGGTPLQSQEYRALLLQPDRTTPAAGIVVEAAEVTGLLAVRAISGANGVVRLRINAPGRYRMRALRVGYPPTEMGFVQLDTGSVHNAGSVVLTSQAVSLASVEVASRRLCGADATSDVGAATALGQARLALASSLLRSPDAEARVYWRAFNMFTDKQGTPLSPLRVSHFETASESPFQSEGAKVLLARGFVRQVNDELIFHAPDAAVLFSDEFVGSHCFSVREASEAGSQVMGVAFEPAPSRSSIAGLMGTMWLDGRSNELRRVDFSFTGIRDLVGEATAGGSLEFRRLPGDLWLIDRWQMRLPRARRVATEGARAQRTVTERFLVNVVEVTGAVVDSIRSGDVTLFSASVPAEAMFPDIVDRVGSVPLCDTEEVVPVHQSGMLFGQIVDSNGMPVDGRTVRASWASPGGSRFSRPELRVSREQVAIGGFYLFCGVPVGSTIQLSIVDGRRSPLSVRLDRVKPYGTFDLVTQALP